MRVHKRLEKFDLVGAVDLGEPIWPAKSRIASPDSPGAGARGWGYAGVVPTVDVTFLDELQQFAPHDRMGEVEASEPGLSRTI